jgi:hypothetical protein
LTGFEERRFGVQGTTGTNGCVGNVYVIRTSGIYLQQLWWWDNLAPGRVVMIYTLSFYHRVCARRVVVLKLGLEGVIESSQTTVLWWMVYLDMATMTSHG